MSPCSVERARRRCSRVEPERFDDLACARTRGSRDRTRARSARRAPSARRSGGTRTRCPAPSCTATSPNRASRASRSSHSSGLNGACGKPGRVQHHLLDGDDVLAVRCRTRGCTRRRAATTSIAPVADEASTPRSRRPAWSPRRSRSASRARRRRASPTRRHGRRARARTGTTGAMPASTSAWARATSAARPLRRSRARSGSAAECGIEGWSRGGAYKRTASILQTRRSGAAGA